MTEKQTDWEWLFWSIFGACVVIGFFMTAYILGDVVSERQRIWTEEKTELCREFGMRYDSGGCVKIDNERIIERCKIVTIDRIKYLECDSDDQLFRRY